MGLEVKGLNVVLNGKQILNQIDLTIAKGEFFSLLGPSGCGKSTLLKTLAGIIRQASGSIIKDGHPIDALPTNRRGIVLVFQDLRLFPHLSVLKNVEFPMKIQGIKKDMRLKKSMELLKQVQLEGLDHRKTAELSGGQQQRVVLARALAAEPDVLLLDEPFSGLNPNLRDDMMELLRNLHQQYKTTMLLVTHNYEEAFTLSDHVAVMDKGMILQWDTPKGLYENPSRLQIAEYFIKGNQVKGLVNNGIFHSDILTIAAPLPDGKYIAVVRPECIVPDPKGERFIIQKSIYLGGIFKIYVQRNNCTLQFMTSAVVDQVVNYKVGEEISLSINMECGLFFPCG